jgi:hypothetical protein
VTLAPPPSYMNKRFPVPPQIQPQPSGGKIVNMIHRVAKVLLKPFGIVVLTVLFFVVTAASSASDTATQIATAIMVIAPLVMPFVLKYIPLDGPKMVALVFGLSVVVAGISAYVAGLFTGLTSVPGILAASTAVFGLSQLIFQGFKDHGTFGPLVTTAPVAAPSDAPAVSPPAPAK